MFCVECIVVCFDLDPGECWLGVGFFITIFGLVVCAGPRGRGIVQCIMLLLFGACQIYIHIMLSFAYSDHPL